MTPVRSIRRAVLALLTAMALLAGCTGTGTEPTVGTVGFMLEIPGIIVPIGGRPVDLVVLRIESPDGSVAMEYELDVVDNMAHVNVDVVPGTWHLDAQVFNADDVLVAYGDGVAVVLPGTITEVNMFLHIVTGALDIDLEWDEGDPLFVADVSHNPVWVEINGVGEYTVSGLSRIGWDIEVFEFPVGDGRTLKEPGELSYPDLAMLYLRSADGDTGGLAAWAASGEPRPMSLILEGLAGEKMRVNLYDAVPVSANTDTWSVGIHGEEEEMGGIRVRYERLEIADYTETFRDIYSDYWSPEPGLRLEVEGVQVYTLYERGVLDVPEPGENPALWLPNLYTGETAYDWADEAREILDQFNAVMRRNISIIDIDADGLETGRINLYEAWPAGLSLFNPEKPYGQTFLVDVYVVAEKAEEG